MTVDDSYTKILLHMDGANLSTTFTDEAGDTWSPQGTAAIYTSYYVFGGSAGGFDGSTAYVTSTASHPAGTGNFVIDFWLNMASATQKARGVFSNRRNAGGSSAEWCVKVGDTNNCLSFHTGAAAIIDDTTHPLSQDTWYHIAFIRSGNTLYYAKDGSIITSSSLTSDLSSTQSFSMAGYDVFATGLLFGRVDELRLSIGTDRGWSSGFTPPTSAYGPIALTVANMTLAQVLGNVSLTQHNVLAAQNMTLAQIITYPMFALLVQNIVLGMYLDNVPNLSLPKSKTLGVKQYNFPTIEKGDSFEWETNLTDDMGNILLGLTAATISCIVKSPYDHSVLADFSSKFTLTSGTGKLSFNLTPADTTAITWSKGIYWLKINYASGITRTIQYGEMPVDLG